MLKYWYTNDEDSYQKVKNICKYAHDFGGIAVQTDCLHSAISILTYVYNGDLQKTIHFCNTLKNSHEKEDCLKIAKKNSAIYAVD